MKQLYLYIFILLLSSSFCYSQQVLHNDAENKNEVIIKNATDLFTEGNYSACISILEKLIPNCKTCYSKNEKANILILLAMSYIETDDIEKADEAIKYIYKNNIHYEVAKTENTPEDYPREVSRFDVHPLFTIGARNSALHATCKTSKSYSGINGVDYTQPYLPNYNSYFISNYYGWLEFQWNKKMSINIEGEFNGFSYYRNLSRGDSWRLYYSEDIKFLEIPVYIKRYVPISKNFISYLALGGGWLHTLTATGYASMSYRSEDIYSGIQTIYSQTNDKIDVLSMRNKNNFEAIGEIAFGYKLRNLKIFLYYRYIKGLNSLTNPEHRFDNPLLLNTYSYIDNSIKLNKYELGATISYVLKNSIKKMK